MEINVFPFKIFVILLLKCSIFSAQVPAFGKCPEVDVAVANNFDLEKYLGLWYEAEKYPFVFEVAGKCITATYGKMENGDVSVVNRQINRFTGNEGKVSGTAAVVSPGKLSVKFTSLPSPANSLEANYWVLDTDYTTFSVVYSCRDLGGLMSGKMVWILTREKNADMETMGKAYAVLDRNKISKGYLMRTDQFNCSPENMTYSLRDEMIL